MRADTAGAGAATLRFFSVLGFVVGAMAVVLVARPAAAHPHVFIDYAVTVQFDHGLPRQVRMSWSYDDMYSDLVRYQLVPTAGDHLSPAEMARIRMKTFDMLAPAHYFTEVRWNRQPATVGDAVDFQVAFVDGRAVYGFTLPLGVTGGHEAGGDRLEIAVFDREYYVHFAYDQNRPPSATGDGALECRAATEPRETRMFGTVDNDLVVCGGGAGR